MTVALPVRKAINGNPRPAGEEETFTFTLVPESGAPASANATVTITDQGAATFGNITFTKTGEYTYTVKETAGSKPGYTYDATVHTVKITVTDVNGVLRAQWKDNNATVTNILFTNKYEPAPAAVTFPVKKVITGNDRPATKTFTFTLAAVTPGAPMQIGRAHV